MENGVRVGRPERSQGSRGVSAAGTLGSRCRCASNASSTAASGPRQRRDRRGMPGIDLFWQLAEPDAVGGEPAQQPPGRPVLAHLGVVQREERRPGRPGRPGGAGVAGPAGPGPDAAAADQREASA